MNWRVVATVVLLGAAAASGWLLLSGKDAPPPEPGTATGDRPDYLLEDFEMVALDAQGHESFTLRAPALARDPGTREMTVATPLFLIPPRDEGGDAWEVRARTGWLSARGEELRLRGDVLARSDGVARAQSTLSTQALDVFPEDDRIASSEPVTLVQPGTTIRGTGLDGDLATARYTLQSEVRIRYVRN
ncbi:LPS export ABC transporter periplasmic protein LptC [Lysobacter sp. GX 14042]|uniref:LPS export ABC transporter periplasmic protein LptC n=1 Tax=Lysobacter sp. GX 14042 TaxID=2907155 RepID=UPI001F47F318|nr:LPS export ABC transporter periplasmic protein LptC [Lysobacter sp. GX 14042]MCE7031857.1 LPS export ABC transporter periplasmic protein LptC [Lysobacter sp. GX 14042]